MIENSKLVELVDKIAINFKPEKIFLSGDSSSGHNGDTLVIQVSKLPTYHRVLGMRRLIRSSNLRMGCIVLTPDVIKEKLELESSSLYKILNKTKLLYEHI